MTRKADFNAEEWSTLVNAPMFAGIRVMAADRGGALREMMSIAQVYKQARERHGESELLDELVVSQPAIDPQQVQQGGGDIAAVAIQHLREANQVIESKGTPEEIEAFKRFVWTVADEAARAHKEGGFLGIGGKPVSENESRALDEISTALGAPPEG